MTRLQQEILRHFNRWRPVLGMEGWDVKICWNERENTATCAAKPKYLRARLYFNLPDVPKEYPTVDEREELVLHEMVHCLMPYASETQVSQVTLSLLRARATTP